jgi:hypothetical protein
MADSQDQWPQPGYHSGPPQHLHAFGVISTCYNAFEDGLFSLCNHHLDQLRLPYGVSDFLYHSLNEHQRLEAVSVVFAQCEKDPAVVALVDNLVKYFGWCRDVRNKLAHAEHYPAMFGGKADKWHLSKRVSKRNSKRGYLELDLKTLRDMADKIEHGNQHCARIIIYLRVRDTPSIKLPRGYTDYVGEPLPGVLDIPDALELSPAP